MVTGAGISSADIAVDIHFLTAPVFRVFNPEHKSTCRHLLNLNHNFMLNAPQEAEFLSSLAGFQNLRSNFSVSSTACYFKLKLEPTKSFLSGLKMEWRKLMKIDKNLLPALRPIWLPHHFG